MPVIVSVQVNRKAINLEFMPGGQGYRWLDRVKLAMHTASVAAAPIRSGSLKAGHRSEIRGLNQNACIATVYNVADHSAWVHEGTNGPIVAENSTWLYIPAGNGYGRKKLRTVAGQRANPWIDRTCTAIAMGLGAVPVG